MIENIDQFKEAFPNLRSSYNDGTEDSYWRGLYDYSELVCKFADIVVSGTSGDYQGDNYWLVEKDGKYGFLVSGYGSCSGCDALQGCDNEEQLFDLYKQMANSVHWFDSLKDAKNYIASITDDEDGNGPVTFYSHEEGWKEFQRDIAAL